MKRRLKLDGSDIEAVLTAAGAGKASSAEKRRVEQWVGAPLPTETQAFLSRPVDHWQKFRARYPTLDTSFLGALPDVSTWLQQLAKPQVGYLQCLQHFVGVYAIGAKLGHGPVFETVTLAPYAGSQVGGVMGYDAGDMEYATFGMTPTVSELLLHSGGAPVPRTLRNEWKKHCETHVARFERLWVSEYLNGGFDMFEKGLPTADEWAKSKQALQTSYPDAMYWLVAHWLLDNRTELKEALGLTAQHRSRGVKTVAAYIGARSLPPAYRRKLDTLHDSVRHAR